MEPPRAPVHVRDGPRVQSDSIPNGHAGGRHRHQVDCAVAEGHGRRRGGRGGAEGNLGDGGGAAGASGEAVADIWGKGNTSSSFLLCSTTNFISFSSPIVPASRLTNASPFFAAASMTIAPPLRRSIPMAVACRPEYSPRRASQLHWREAETAMVLDVSDRQLLSQC